MERADIRRRTQRGRRTRAAAGKLIAASFPLYGYLWVQADAKDSKDRKIAHAVDSETGYIVVRIFVSLAEGMPIRKLCKQLEDEGIPTPGQVIAARGQLPTGKTASAFWRPGTILRIVHNPAYWGAGVAYRWQSKAVKERLVETGVTRKRRVQVMRADDDQTRILLPESTCPPLVTPEIAARVQARLRANQLDLVGRPVADPLSTLWRGLVVCGHCGARLHTAPMQGSVNRKYTCLGERADKVTSKRTPCPGGAFSMSAAQLDPAGWADMLAWLSKPENADRLLAGWQDDSANTVESAASRLEAIDRTIRDLRGKMDDLVKDIDETTQRESRRVLRAQLDAHAAQVEQEEGKRMQLLHESADADAQAAAAAEFRACVREVAKKAAGYDRAQQRDTLLAFGAQMTLWRADYVHADGWPQRYKIGLLFTGWTGAPVTLPPSVQKLSLTS